MTKGQAKAAAKTAAGKENQPPKPNNSKKQKRNRKREVNAGQSTKDFSGTVGASVAYSTAVRQGEPTITRSRGGMRVKHRELVQSLNGSIAFTATKVACQPGLTSVFAWLGPIAQEWEQYKFHALKFEYITRTATTTVGSVLLVPDYDASDAAPTTEVAASSYRDTVEDVTWRDICCELDATAMFGVNPRKFVRSGAIAGTDIKLYDAANLFICTVEEIGASAIGKVWVEYDVEFWIPQTLASSSASSQITSLFTQHTLTTFTTTVAKNIAFDTTTTDPLSIGSAVTGTFTPTVAGAYLIQANATFADSSAEGFTVTMELFKNGATLTNPVKAEYKASGATIAGFAELFVQGVLVLNGTTDTFAITATMTGAAGTLTCPADMATIVIVPA